MATKATKKKAAAFRLQDQDGNTVQLSDFRGRKLLVYFYPKADTPGCTQQACSIRDAWDQLTARGVSVVGISPDPPERQKKFQAKHGLNFPLLADTDHKVAEAYGAWGEKSMYGKKYEGIIRSSFLVDEQGNLHRAWPKVSPKDTVPFALQALEG